ncbi:MAG: ribonuclease Z [bacterium]
MDIVLLGTSASLPTRHRKPISTALMREGEILLFDCGEGTQMQFQKAGLKPGKLSKIFISHFHGDHFYGLVGLLTSLQLGGRAKPLNLYGPEGLRKYLEFMQRLSNFKLDYGINIYEVKQNSQETVWDLGEYFVKAKPLIHGIFVLGFKVEERPKPGKFNVQEAKKLGIADGPLRGRLQKGESVVLPNGKDVIPSQVIGSPRPGKKVAICLDTKPCRNSIELSKEVDLLIHDGTFDETQTEWANTTGHSTVVQAAAIAQEAGAKKLVLTHLSARYKEADEYYLLVQAKKLFPNTIIGQDLMKIKI